MQDRGAFMEVGRFTGEGGGYGCSQDPPTGLSISATASVRFIFNVIDLVLPSHFHAFVSAN
jgi:hypothetical protein